MYMFSRAGDAQGNLRKRERTQAGVLITGTYFERGEYMSVFESATRFDGENYYKMSIDSENEVVTITGEMDGEPVAFSTNHQVKTVTGLQTSDGASFVISNLEHEPEAIILMIAQTYTMASGKKVLCFNSKASAVLIGQGTTSVAFLASTNRISFTYADGTLTVTITDTTTLGNFITNSNYSLTYIY